MPYHTNLHLPFCYWHLCFHPAWHDINFVRRHVLSCAHLLQQQQQECGSNHAAHAICFGSLHLFALHCHSISFPSTVDTCTSAKTHRAELSLCPRALTTVWCGRYLSHSHAPSLSRWLDYQIKLSATNDDERSEKLSTAVPLPMTFYPSKWERERERELFR